MPDPTRYDYEQAYQPRRSSTLGFGQGLLSGAISQIQQDRLREESTIAETRNRALEWLKAIPMTEHNAPIVTNMALDVLSAKPGKKHWTDAIFATGEGTNQFVQDLYGRLRTILPKTGPLEPEMSAGAGPAGPVDISDLAQQPSTRPRTVTQQPEQQPGEAISPTPLVGPARPVPPSLGTVEFPSVGKYKTFNDVFEDAAGNSYIMQYDENKGISRRIPLGNVTTGRERVAAIAAKAKVEAARNAVDKGVMKDVLIAAAADGLSAEAFHALPYEAQQKYYTQAGVAARTMQSAKLGGIQAEAGKDIAQGKFYSAQTDYMGSSGGLTPNQVNITHQKNLDDATQYYRAFQPIRDKALAAKSQLDDLQYNRLKTQYFGDVTNPEFIKEKARLENEYTQAYQTAKDYAEKAATLHPGLLDGGLGVSKPGDTPFPYINPIKEGFSALPGQIPGRRYAAPPPSATTPTGGGTQPSGQPGTTTASQWDKIISRETSANPQVYDATAGPSIGAPTIARGGGVVKQIPIAAFELPLPQLQARIGKLFTLPDAHGKLHKGKILSVDAATGVVNVQWLN